MEANNVKNILISNVYSWENKGDVAIIYRLIQEVKKLFPSAKIAFSTYDSNDIGKYGDYEMYLNPLAMIEQIKNPLIRLLKSFLFLICLNIFEIFTKLGMRPYFLLPKRLRKKVRSYEKFDLVIACGGGYLITKNFKSIITKLLFAYDFYIAHFFRRPYLLYNQSVGPFSHEFHFYLIKRFLKNAKIIICREEVCYKRLKKRGYNNLINSFDIAFTLDSNKSSKKILEKYGFNKNNINIGLSARKWLDDKNQRKFEKEIANFIEAKVKENKKIMFYFMPQTLFLYKKENDFEVYDRICGYLPDDCKSRVEIVNDDLHPIDLKQAYSYLDVVIATRFHSNILCLSALVKTISILYDFKTYGSIKRLKTTEYAIGMNNVTKEILNKKFEQIIKDKDYKKRLMKNMENMKKMGLIDLRKYL